MIRLNSRGRSVILLQQQLRYLGFYSGLTTGVCDAVTVTSIRSYQASRRLTADGVVGPISEQALRWDTGTALLVLFLHCAATPEGRDVKSEAVVSWHTSPPPNGRGWDRPGYSDIIELSGKLVNVRKWDIDDQVTDWEVTHGVQVATLLNRNARHLCYIGGTEANNINVPKDTRTRGQLDAMETYVKFHILRYPHILVLGHNQVQSNRRGGCPSFDVPAWLRSIGVEERNIGVFGFMGE
jgi:N-acetylmuramoyl-L-alanine amidase